MNINTKGFNKILANLQNILYTETKYDLYQKYKFVLISENQCDTSY